MEKLIFLTFLLVSQYIFSDENFKLNFNLATTGIGLNYASNDEEDNVELFVEILTVGIEHKDTNVGIGLSPLKYWYFWRGDEPDTPINEDKLSFINFNIHWNLLDNNIFFLGPFCSINYLLFNNLKMNWAEYIFTGGIRFIWRFNIFKENIFSNFISSDIGYRIINGKNNFHFNISIDIISLSYGIAISRGYGVTNSK